MTLTGLDTVAIVVSDKRTAIAWYRNVLELEVAYICPPEAKSDPTIQGSPDNPGHWIEMGPRRPMTRIHLCELADHHTEPGPSGITFLSNNILEDYDRLKKKGVHFLGEPKRMDWGEWLCQFVDPDGNEFDLKQ
jgi:catechol 2,3-dioxygenase-like lactoylglutathione lyase family enzyme